MSFCSVPPSRARGVPAFSACRDEHREDRRRRRVDRHRRRRRTEIDPGVEVLHVGQRVDRHPAPTDLTQRHRIVGVQPSNVGMSNAVDNPSPPALDDLLEPPVRVVRRAEPGEHPHRPQLRPVTRRIRPPRVRVHTRALAVVRPVRPARPEPPTSSTSRRHGCATPRMPAASAACSSSCGKITLTSKQMRGVHSKSP